ncbi:Man1-Src1p-C-terminal domain-domain-containing protein [Naematelia encephala]|uniref:Man1-Src1p-C-terminal domain-domain-containing protein n=1 Tax=Naematelia encephala TaxID=71784 RepID=A0A1Y2ACI3_9TREE|nr:Man1-Src1p-C-terminal domain-domain-containing protein [Naematelia encephala]
MSNPTIEEYLQPGFDAASLKVAQLRGILLGHGISLSAMAKKAELLQAFDERVKPLGPKLLAAASKIQPSNQGFITVSENGDETTEPKKGRGRSRKVSETIDAPEPPAKKPRGRSRSTNPVTPDIEVKIETVETPAPKKGRGRQKKVKAEDADDEDEGDGYQPVPPTPRSTRSRLSTAATPDTVPSVQSAPSSSRRRSAQPSSSSVTSERVPPEPDVKRSAGKRKSTTMDEVKEESEKEDTPKKKTPRPKTPRRSEDSGFSDFNPFQSGAEDAGEREQRRRKSSVGLSARKPAQPRFSEPARSTTPSSTLRRVGPSREELKTPPKEVRDAMLRQQDLDAAQQYNDAVSDKIAQLSSGQVDLGPAITTVSHVQSPTSLVKRVKAELPSVKAPRSLLPLSALLLLLLSFIANYKNGSASIGYCDPANNVNDITLTRQSELDDARACIDRRTLLDLDTPGAGKAIECDVSALPLVPFLPRPTACTPCPPHAICEDGQITACEPEFLLASHPLSFLSPVVDGLPGIGPRAFPPSCRPDTAKKRLIGGLAKEMESLLAKGRGQVVCAGLGKEDGRKGPGERFGMSETTLRQSYEQRRDPKISKEQFDEIFDAALNDLVEHDDVVESIDTHGVSYYAASRTDLTLGCRAKLEAVDMLEKWKSQLSATALVCALIAYLHSTIKHRKAEKYKAEELVQVVLKRLQDQETLHYADPVTTPHPFVPPAQLRDVVLPHSGSTNSKTRLWQRVVDLVEANANVATREQEVHGEVWKTWQWQGVGERHVTWA